MSQGHTKNSQKIQKISQKGNVEFINAIKTNMAIWRNHLGVTDHKGAKLIDLHSTVYFQW